MQSLDLIVFLSYFVTVSALGLWIYWRNRSQESSSSDYFLAEGKLTWWAIGASIIASNISAEQFIGMSGSGFAIGLAIASYEWIGAATLILVAVFFMPGYIKHRIFTMPQFLTERYGELVATLLAVFWLLVYVFVNLTSILYLGALTVDGMTGIGFTACVIGLGLFAFFIAMGGMKVIGYTDVFQVLVLVVGGLVTTWIALDLVAAQFGRDGLLAGFTLLQEKAPGHFKMVLDSSHPDYKDLPGISAVIGGMWIANISYWGCNQYITQRALGANLETARLGILFAAAMKLFMPVIVVLPGIAVYVIHQNGGFEGQLLDAAGVVKPDKSYSALIALLPAGLKGLSFAALTAAIVASLAGKANSIATIFALDIYKRYMNQHASEQALINVGRIAIAASILISLFIAPQLGHWDQAIQYVQEYTGFISPGVCAIFLFGFFWRKASSLAALVAAILTIPLSTIFKFAWPELPFLNRMLIVFLLLSFLMIVLSYMKPDKERKLDIGWDPAAYRVGGTFLVGSIIVLGSLAALYATYW